MSDALAPRAALPTYATVADVLEKKNGSGIRLLGWTIARTVMIAPPLLLVGVPWRKALAGAALASGLISLFTLVRIYNAGYEEEWKARIRARHKARRSLPRTSAPHNFAGARMPRRLR